jgi:hypothetical protein
LFYLERGSEKSSKVKEEKRSIMAEYSQMKEDALKMNVEQRRYIYMTRSASWVNSVFYSASSPWKAVGPEQRENESQRYRAKNV